MLLTFDFTGDVPLYLQIRNQIVMGIGSGSLQPGEKLPTVRALAEESGVNTMTVSKAYNLLKQEGYITTDRRKGATVCAKAVTGQVKQETKTNLKLCLSELKAAGQTADDIHRLVDELLRESELG